MEHRNVWLITAKTNLHVGDENTSSYGLIDKAIQRDALTSLPCINSSSLKGAINEWATNNNGMDSQQLIEIFGCDKKGRDKETKKGKYIFFDANIIAIPRQSDNGRMFEMVTCQEVLERISEKLRAFGVEVSTKDLRDKVKADKVIDNNEFASLCSDDNLPIIARNCLENGVSTNLWYEQILPAETVLIAAIADNGDSTLSEKMNGQIVQIGANATIGYGYCKMEHI